jgi:hypothetical protein
MSKLGLISATGVALSGALHSNGGPARSRLALAAVTGVVRMALASIAVAAPGEAQRTLQVPQGVACQTCVVDVATVVTVGGPNDKPDSGEFGAFDIAAVNSKGEVVVGHVTGGRLSVFDSRGRFVRTIGRPGAGPMEFRAIVALSFDVFDTLHVFDVGNARRTVLSPDWRLARQSPIPPRLMRNQVILLSGDRTLINAQIRTPELAGLPFHVVDGSGKIASSFGAGDPITRANPNADTRIIARRAADEFWAAPLDAYRIEAWDLTGHHRGTILQQAAWIAPNPSWDGYDGSPPPSSVAALWTDEAGHLWVFFAVAAKEWQSGLDIKRTASGSIARMSLIDPSKVYDTRVDVLDVQAGRLLATRLFPFSVSGVTPAGLVYSTRLDESGFARLDVMRVSLKDTSLRR